MRATAIEVTDRSAIVELRPCWVARLFGALTMRVEIVRQGSTSAWLTKYGIDNVSHIPNGDIILRALDFRPVGSLPQARLLP